MRIGRLRQRITIQRCTESADDYGQRTKTWTTHKAMWAMLEFDGGNEQTEAQRTQAVRSGSATIRYLADVSPKDRFTFGGRTFQITAVINSDRHKGETLLRFAETV